MKPVPLMETLPEGLTRVFFCKSGAEASDAAIKLARKATGRPDVISTDLSFHGRTVGTASATGQATHRDKFEPLMPHSRVVPFNNVKAMSKALDKDVAAVILEPLQGEKVASGHRSQRAVDRARDSCQEP